MTDEPNLDRSERPAEVDRLVGRLNRPRSLPGPDPTHSPSALASPAPTVADEGPTADPASEVQITPSKIFVTVELPGVPKEEIDVHVWEDRVTVHGLRPGGPSYDLEISLPGRVDPRSATSSYRNGVLDIMLRRDPAEDVSRGESDE